MKIDRLLILFLFVISCDLNSSRNNHRENISDSYTPLAIGNVHQYYFSDDSSTWLHEIVACTTRTDGQIVYVNQFQYGTYQPSYDYFYIKNGYYTVTNLDTIRDSTGTFNTMNPFRECMIGVENPADGMTWISRVGDLTANPWRAEYEESKLTIAGRIQNVFAFHTECDTIRCFQSIYYGKGIGWLGSAFFGDTTSLYPELCYAKIGNYEIGKLLPPKNPNHRFKRSASDVLNLESFLGIKPFE
jgi:hypothetical protein